MDNTQAGTESENKDTDEKKEAARLLQLEISDGERSGSLTGIGIILGFSLTFIYQWTTGSGKWRWPQAVALIVTIPGVIAQLVALYRVLSLPRIKLGNFQLAIKRWFLVGIIWILCGYLIHVAIDFYSDATSADPSPPPCCVIEKKS